ncbi:unnamed protein product, partial [Allacma fusca]
IWGSVPKPSRAIIALEASTKTRKFQCSMDRAVDVQTLLTKS